MACPFLQSLQQAADSNPASGTMCPFSSSKMLQQCPASACPASQSLASDAVQAQRSSYQRGMLTPSSSSDSLTEHQDIAPFRHSSSSSTSSSSSYAQAQSSCSTINSSNSNRSYSTHQAWQLKRPVLQHDPKLTRRQLRQLQRGWTLADVAQHKYCDDGWIAVEGKVYDITEHLVSHPGWDSGCQVTTVLSIIAHLGSDCSEEFREIHRPYPVAWKQLQVFYIGDLVCS